jgi:hypothetical protein
MSDFDAVLERLLTDPSFATQLAADPDGALSGYKLAAGEGELLRQQVAVDSTADLAAVESRMTKSSTFGLLSPFAGTGALADMLGHKLSGGNPAAPPAAPLGPWSEFGSAAGIAAQHAADVAGEPGATQGLGSAPEGWGEGGGTMGARSGLGDAPDADLDGLPAVTRLGDAPRSALGDASGQGDAGGQGSAEARQIAPPKGYHNRVDADGDGDWDKATYRGHEGGGAEILVDLDGDGSTDFIGYDTDVDNRVDYADFDKDRDGVFDKRMYDDDGDGWMDRTKFLEH